MFRWQQIPGSYLLASVSFHCPINHRNENVLKSILSKEIKQEESNVKLFYLHIPHSKQLWHSQNIEFSFFKTEKNSSFNLNKISDKCKYNLDISRLKSINLLTRQQTIWCQCSTHKVWLTSDVCAEKKQNNNELWETMLENKETEK